MSIQTALKLRLMEQRGYTCGCGCGRRFDANIGRATLAHVILHDQKKHHEFLTSDINCEVVRLDHHDKTNSQEFREWFYQVQLKRYGNLVQRYFREAQKRKIFVESWMLKGG